MTGRERFLTALSNGKPDRLPCQVHCWMQYYLDTYLSGRDQFEAYRYFEMDPVIYSGGIYAFRPEELQNWVAEERAATADAEGVTRWTRRFLTPEGELTVEGATNRFTSWETKTMIRTKVDFELYRKYFPVPCSCDFSPVLEAKKIIGDTGIVRGIPYQYGQVGAWQSLCCLVGTEELIYLAVDEPDWVHYALSVITEKTVRGVQNAGKIPLDLVETGGGAASSTVISPEMHRQFCVPYDKKLHDAIHEQGGKVVYHLCGGLMPLLDMMPENGADCLETMTPAAMGADCVLKEAEERAGKKLALIGGFDQNAGFERGNPETVRRMVAELFAACPDGGYICSPSDHFFFGAPENIRAFAAACKDCRY